MYTLNNKGKIVKIIPEPKEDNSISFKEATKILNIEDYSEKIFNSNSKGELFHIWAYIDLAKSWSKLEPNKLKEYQKSFRRIFIKIVKHANDNWERPESVYQHFFQIIRDSR